MATETQNRSGGTGFLGALTIAFIVLKLIGQIGWSWLWVLAPLWIPWAVILGVLAVVYLIATLIEGTERAESMLANAKRYLIHLRDDVGHDEWPGQKDDSFEARNRHHAEAWRKSRRKARV